MKRKLQYVLLTVITFFVNYSWAITNQELTIIYNTIVGDQTLTLNAELSNAYLKKDLEKAMYYAQETLKEALSTGSVIGVPYAHQQIGKVHLEKGELLEALEQFLITQEKHKSTKNWKEIALNNILIGDVYAKTGDVLRAKNEFNKCKEIGDRTKNNSISATAFIALFDLQKNKKTKLSERLLNQGLAFISKIKSLPMKAAFYTIIGQRNYDIKEYEKAVFYYNKSIVLHQLTNNIESLVETYYEVGKTKEKLKLFNDAKMSYEKGFETAKNNSYLAGIKIGCLKLSSFYESQGNYKKSSLYLKYLNKIKTLQGEAELKARIELADQEKELILEKEQSKSDLKFKNTFLVLLSIIIGVLILFLLLLFYAFRTKSSFIRQLELSNTKILSVQKEKDDFLAYTSHEIRTPLSAVVGSAELLENTKLTKPQKKHLSSLKTSANNILFLVNDILDLSKLEKRKITLENISFSLDKLITNIFTALDSKAVKNNVSLNKKINPTVPKEIVGDPIRLHQVLINLIDNAIKFSKNGDVFLSIDFNQEESKSFILFEIKDNGVGIEPLKLNSIFKPYVQENDSTSRQYGGTGLGLSICRNIIEIMGGEISVNSVVNKGSVFFFKIPFINAIIKDEIDNPVYLEKLKILLVEDDLLNGELYSSLLKNETRNVSVDWVKNGQEALDILLSGNAYEIILMDLEMPIKNGIETTKEIRKNTNLINVPILGMTAHVLSDVLEKCINAGMNDCISKPFQAKQLKKKIKKLLDSTNNIVFDDLKQKDSLKKAKYLAIFEESFKTDLENLRNAINNKDLDLLNTLLHKMKGASLTIGISELSDLLIKIEQKKSLDLNEEFIVLQRLFIERINILKKK